MLTREYTSLCNDKRKYFKSSNKKLNFCNHANPWFVTLQLSIWWEDEEEREGGENTGPDQWQPSNSVRARGEVEVKASTHLRYPKQSDCFLSLGYPFPSLPSLWNNTFAMPWIDCFVLGLLFFVSNIIFCGGSRSTSCSPRADPSQYCLQSYRKAHQIGEIVISEGCLGLVEKQRENLFHASH